jgi:hypothetical protein
LPSPAGAEAGGGSLDVLDPEASEDDRSERLFTEFLGLQSTQLCPVFGFDENRDLGLAFQVLTSFLFLKLFLYIAEASGGLAGPSPSPQRRISAETGSHVEPVAVATPSVTPRRKEALDELNHFSSVVDDHLGESSRLGGISSQSERDTERQELRDAIQDTIRKQQERWQTKRQQREESKSPMQLDRGRTLLPNQQVKAEIPTAYAPLQASSSVSDPSGIAQDPVEPNDPTLMMPVIYWAWQVTMAVILQIAMLISLAHYANAGGWRVERMSFWSHYNLYIFAFANSGMLPSAVQAVFWAYQFIVNSSMNIRVRAPTASTLQMRAVADPGTGSEGDDAFREDEEVAHMSKWLLILLVPLLLPLLLTTLTHMVPFAFTYVWMIALTAMLAAAGIYLLQLLGDYLRLSTQRKGEAAILVMQLSLTLLLHSSVKVMTYIYSGEFRHGGYFDHLLEHAFQDRFAHGDCTWLSFNFLVDAVLCWF